MPLELNAKNFFNCLIFHPEQAINKEDQERALVYSVMFGLFTLAIGPAVVGLYQLGCYVWDRYQMKDKTKELNETEEKAQSIAQERSLFPSKESATSEIGKAQSIAKELPKEGVAGEKDKEKEIDETAKSQEQKRLQKDDLKKQSPNPQRLDYVKAMEQGDFSCFIHLVREELKDQKNKDVLVEYIKFFCLCYILIDEKDHSLLDDLLFALGDSLNKNITLECAEYLSVCDPLIELQIKLLNNKNSPLRKKNVFPENFDDLSSDEKARFFVINKSKFSKLFSENLLGRIYDKKNKEDGTYILKKQSIQRKLDESLNKIENQKEKRAKEQAEEKKLKDTKEWEATLTPFMSILKSSTFENSTDFIKKFSIDSKFSSCLWAFAHAFPSKEIPYEDFDPKKEKISDFLKSIEKSIIALKECVALYKQFPALCEKIEDLVKTLEGIKVSAQSLISEQRFDEKTLSALKVPSFQKDNLRFELIQIEREDFLNFIAHLHVVSSYNKSSSASIAEGLHKLRDYIIKRNPRQHDMSLGRFGVAGYIFEYCLQRLFLKINMSEIAYITDKMRIKRKEEESLIHLAEVENTGGHFVCHVLTDKGEACLDSMGSRKTLYSSQYLKERSHSVMVVSESFYQSCRPLQFDNIQVPNQQANNCYLAAGWLKFHTFLHFYLQSIRPLS